MNCLTRLSLTLVGLFYAVPTIACTCAVSPFLELTESMVDNYVIQFRVTSHSNRDAPGLTFMDGEIVQQFKGDEITGSLRIYGGGGLSCMPYAYTYETDRDWLLLVNEAEGKFYLNACQPKISIEENTLTGLVTPLACSGPPRSGYTCFSHSQRNLAGANSEEMSIREFESALQLYASAVSMTLNACEGPWSRCKAVRPSFDPSTGVLHLPSLDVISDPEQFPTYGISATLQTDETQSPENFKVIDFGGPRGLLHLDRPSNR